MDPQNLQTASTYINNLLLARGLLRNGKSIHFARPSQEDGGADATMAKVINLVHDLVLRRDREADQRENLAITIRDLRSTERKNLAELERLQIQNADSERRLSIARGQEHAHKATLQAAESANRSLREEMQRLRHTLQQVRTQCANDVRKRDLSIQKLKSHLSAQQRGARLPFTGSTITVTPHALSKDLETPEMSHSSQGVALDSSDYNLKQETTEFLTKLSQNLCDENDNLLGLVRASVRTLRELQGITPTAAQTSSQRCESAQEANPEDSGPIANDSKQELAKEISTSYETLAGEMDEVLENLRVILTNPSFVPLEEVEAREEEILRLREGWEKMESRWREAVTLMDSWSKRMASGGGSVNLEELKMGLNLSPVRFDKSTAHKTVVAEDGKAEHHALHEYSGCTVSDDEDVLEGIDSFDSAVEEESASEDEAGGSPEPHQASERVLTVVDANARGEPQKVVQSKSASLGRKRRLEGLENDDLPSSKRISGRSEADSFQEQTQAPKHGSGTKASVKAAIGSDVTSSSGSARRTINTSDRSVTTSGKISQATIKRKLANASAKAEAERSKRVPSQQTKPRRALGSTTKASRAKLVTKDEIEPRQNQPAARQRNPNAVKRAARERRRSTLSADELAALVGSS